MISAGFVVSTRSIADKKTHAGSSSINQRNPNSNYAEGVLRARGFFVHYLALTFSTLLSSQVSGAHRTGLVVLGLGQRPTLRGLASPSQTRTFWFIQDHQSPDLMHLLRARIHPNISLASGFLPGRPLQIDRSDASRAPLRPHILYACTTERSNPPGRCACASAISLERTAGRGYSAGWSLARHSSGGSDGYGAYRAFAAPQNGESPVQQVGPG